LKDRQIKEIFNSESSKIIIDLIFQLEAAGHDVKINLYKKDRKEIRILAKESG